MDDDSLILYDKELDNVSHHCAGERLAMCVRRDGYPCLVFEDGTCVVVKPDEDEGVVLQVVLR